MVAEGNYRVVVVSTNTSEIVIPLSTRRLFDPDAAVPCEVNWVHALHPTRQPEARRQRPCPLGVRRGCRSQTMINVDQADFSTQQRAKRGEAGRERERVGTSREADKDRRSYRQRKRPPAS